MVHTTDTRTSLRNCFGCAILLIGALPAFGADRDVKDRPVSVPGIVIDHLAASSGQYVGSPSIAILPSGDYVASHDIFGPKSRYREGAGTRVFGSSDRGRSWVIS